MKDAGAPLLFKVEERRRKKKRRPKKKVPWQGSPIKCTGRLKDIMMRHYFLARYAGEAMPVAWVTSGAPVEILRPFGFYTIYPENHGAVCGARMEGKKLCEIAESIGFSQDLCSYAKIDLAHSFTGETPVGKLPKPDLGG